MDQKAELKCALCGRPLAANEGDPCDVCREERRPSYMRELMLDYVDLTIGVGGIIALVVL